MTNICLDCGHIFEDCERATWEENHGLPGGWHETFSGCPICKGDYEEAEKCTGCQSVHLADDLYEGYCMDCLRDEATYRNIWDFLKENDLASDFMFDTVWESDIPAYSSDKLKAELEEIYWRKVADDKLRKCEDFLKMGQDFVLDPAEIAYWAEWVAERNKGE